MQVSDSMNQNSNYSNRISHLSHKSQGLQTIQCEEHPHEIITNFCIEYKCVKPLCPECIQNHNKYHSQRGENGVIESFKNVKQNCSKKLKIAIEQLNKCLDKLEQDKFNQQSVIDQQMSELLQFKQQVIDKLDQLCKEVEQSIRLKVSKINVENMKNEQLDQLYNLINELELEKTNLESNQCDQSIKKICQMDLKHIIDKQKSMMDRYKVQLTQIGFKLVIDKCKSGNLMSSISRLAYLMEDESNEFLEPSIQLPNLLNQNIQQSHQQQIFQSVYQQQSNHNNIQQSIYQQPHQQYEYNSMNMQQSNLMKQSKLINEQQRHRIRISQKNSLQTDKQNHCLYYFPFNQRQMIQYNIQENKQECFELENDFDTPVHHQVSISNMQEIFMVGGYSSKNPMKKNGTVYKLYKEKGRFKLGKKGNLLQGRSCFGAVIVRNCIYVIGGHLTNQIVSSSCEKFDLKTLKSQVIESMYQESYAHSVCVFNNRYIMRFGGLDSQKQLNNSIEKYDSEFDRWEQIDPLFDLDGLQIQLSDFRLFSDSQAVQINKQQIMVFGGYDQYFKPQNMSLVMHYQINQQNQEEWIIKMINYKPTPYNEGFWSVHTVLSERLLYVYQNTSTQDSLLRNSEVKKKLFMFDGVAWNQIVI